MPLWCGAITVLVTTDSPSAANADPSMTAPEGYVYVKVTTGTSDDDYIAVTSGLQEGDTVAYTASSTASVSADGQMAGSMMVAWRARSGAAVEAACPSGGGGMPGGGSDNERSDRISRMCASITGWVTPR